MNCAYIMIEAILNWAEKKPWFDVSFIYSLKEQLDEKGELTLKQLEALDNIIDRFNIAI